MMFQTPIIICLLQYCQHADFLHNIHLRYSAANPQSTTRTPLETTGQSKHHSPANLPHLHHRLPGQQTFIPSMPQPLESKYHRPPLTMLVPRTNPHKSSPCLTWFSRYHRILLMEALEALKQEPASSIDQVRPNGIIPAPAETCP